MDWEIRENLSDKYIIDRSCELGSGSSAIVYRCKEVATQKEYAIKILRRKIGDSSLQRKRIEREVQILKSITHPNILKVIDIFLCKAHLHIVTELCEGDLRNMDRTRMTECDIIEIVQKICLVVDFLHSHDVVHRDLKLENLLYRTNDPTDIVVGDFGVSRFIIDTPCVTMVGTPQYIAPEIFEGEYGPEVDMWAVGVICYILLSGTEPFQGEMEKIIHQIKQGSYSLEGPEWESVSENSKDFVKKLIEVDWKKRMTPKEALSHFWLTGCSLSLSTEALPPFQISENCGFEGPSKLGESFIFNDSQALPDYPIQFGDEFGSRHTSFRVGCCALVGPILWIGSPNGLVGVADTRTRPMEFQKSSLFWFGKSGLSKIKSIIHVKKTTPGNTIWTASEAGFIQVWRLQNGRDLAHDIKLSKKTSISSPFFSKSFDIEISHGKLTCSYRSANRFSNDKRKSFDLKTLADVTAEKNDVLATFLKQEKVSFLAPDGEEAQKWVDYLSLCRDCLTKPEIIFRLAESEKLQAPILEMACNSSGSPIVLDSEYRVNELSFDVLKQTVSIKRQLSLNLLSHSFVASSVCGPIIPIPMARNTFWLPIRDCFFEIDQSTKDFQTFHPMKTHSDIVVADSYVPSSKSPRSVAKREVWVGDVEGNIFAIDPTKKRMTHQFLRRACDTQDQEGDLDVKFVNVNQMTTIWKVNRMNVSCGSLLVCGDEAWVGFTMPVIDAVKRFLFAISISRKTILRETFLQIPDNRYGVNGIFYLPMSKEIIATSLNKKEAITCFIKREEGMKTKEAEKEEESD